MTKENLFGLLGAKASWGVCDTDVHLRSTVHDVHALAGRHVVRNLSTVLAVVHHQQLQIGHVVDDELVEAVWQQVAGDLVGTETNLHVWASATESTAEAAINTAWGAPRGL